MKFLRFTTQEDNILHNGICDGEKIIETLHTPLELIENPDLIKKSLTTTYSLEDIQIETPITPTKVVCIGLNYKDHAEELKMTLPTEPRIFIKPSNTVISHQEIIQYPDTSDEVDYEAELGVIILKEAYRVVKEEADDYIAGYTCLNDVTARDLQRKDEQWTRAKSFNTFCPIGPYIETDLNPMNLKIQSQVNNEIKQDSNTKNMIFSPQELVEFISNIMTLYPGDIIATGTPPGVGKFYKGDKIKIIIENIGTLENSLQ